MTTSKATFECLKLLDDRRLEYYFGYQTITFSVSVQKVLEREDTPRSREIRLQVVKAISKDLNLKLCSDL